MRGLLKGCLHGVFLALSWPLAALSLWGRLRGLFTLGAQACALVPGLPGDYLRICYYRWTLRECALEARIQFGSFFAHPEAVVERGVYIGSYSILGRVKIGARTQIGSGVMIPSGKRQHSRGADGTIGGSALEQFETIEIGPDCWIGTQAVILAAVGAGSTIGAGTIVVKPLPGGVTAVGNPARIIKGESRV